MPIGEDRRSKLRIHQTTYVAFLICLTLEMLIVIPGHPTVATPAFFSKSREHGFHVTYHHGWPWVYFKSMRMEVDSPNSTLDLKKLNALTKEPLTTVEAHNNKRWYKLEKAQSRTWTGRNYDINKKPYWKIPERWMHYGNRQRIDFGGLFLDLIAVISIAAIPAALIEWRIRSAARGFQLRIADVLILTTLVALIVGTFASELRARHFSSLIAQSPVCSSSRYVGQSYGQTQDSPPWLLRLIGAGHCERFRKIKFLSLSEPALAKLAPDVLDELAEQVRAYGRIRCIDIFQTGPCVQRLMSQVGKVPRVRVWPAHADREKWNELAQTNGWNVLTFENEP